MITSNIGKIFLDAYNNKNGTDYDGKSFFIDVYHPLFFGANKYLQWVQNSPFVQMKKGQKVETLTLKEIDEKLKDFIAKVDGCMCPDASIAPGFPASEEKEFATTSGQVSNLSFSVNVDEIYLSWIGSSLGIGLSGGLSILFSEPEILLDLFDGWKLYRKIISEGNNVKGNQINTWNGQWLSHCYDNTNFYQEQPMADFNPFDDASKDGIGIKTQSWVKVLIGISKKFTNPQMMGYVYNFGQTNTTIGFIPFYLEHIRKPIQLYEKLFGSKEGGQAEELWGTEFGLRTCCQMGRIGVEAMQPKGMRQYIFPDKNGSVKFPKYNDSKLIEFHTYQIWLLAMLNNDELWEKSTTFAKVLYDFVSKDKKLSTKRSNLVDKIFESSSKRTFILALNEIVSDAESLEQIEEHAKIIHMMPADNVSYYLALIRFHFSLLKKK